MCICCEIYRGLTSRVVRCDVIMHYNCTIHFYPCMIHLLLYGYIFGKNKCTLMYKVHT